ncbi:MAG: sigma-E processing peptidase SpoIIGA [Clostridia bacterium]|nr:sigma-E processing peptidase SpoIIGA [Clostridia bacterium]
MKQDVYADLLFLINFSMDYLCLYICARILHRPVKLVKTLIAAAIGGAYSVLSLFFTFASWVALIIDVCVCIIMCSITFAERDRPLSSTCLCAFLFVGISMMTGGCMTAIFNLLNKLNLPLDGIEEDGISTYLFAILAAIAGLISLRSGEVVSRRAPIKECILKITLDGKQACFRGLSDSGNLVKDPISGRSVIIVDRSVLQKITDISRFDRFQHGEAPDTALRLIPINTAGGRSVLVAIRPQQITAEAVRKNGKKTSFELDALIAPSDLGSSAEGYNAIIPSEILKA